MISNSYFRVMDLGSLEKNFRNSILKRDKNNFSYYIEKVLMIRHLNWEYHYRK